jgi:hypothetical protein
MVAKATRAWDTTAQSQLLPPSPKPRLGKLGEENNKSPNSRFSDNLKQTTTSCAQDSPKPHATLKQLVSVVSSIVVAIGLRPWFSSSRHQQRERGKMATTATKKKTTKLPKTMLYAKKKKEVT